MLRFYSKPSAFASRLGSQRSSDLYMVLDWFIKYASTRGSWRSLFHSQHVEHSGISRRETCSLPRGGQKPGATTTNSRRRDDPFLDNPTLIIPPKFPLPSTSLRSRPYPLSTTYPRARTRSTSYHSCRALHIPLSPAHTKSTQPRRISSERQGSSSKGEGEDRSNCTQGSQGC